MVRLTPSRITVAVAGINYLSASIAPSARFYCHTPTIALSVRMSKMINGYTKSARLPSINAITKLIAAAANKMRTSKSSNWARTSYQNGVAGVVGSSFLPYYARRSAISSSLVNPVLGLTFSRQHTSALERNAASLMTFELFAIFRFFPFAFFFESKEKTTTMKE